MMSHSSGYRTACANYQACHLKSGRLFDNSARNVFSPRCHEMDRHTCSARTSSSVDEELLHSRRDDSHQISLACGSQVYASNYTKYLELKVAKIQDQHQKIASEKFQLSNHLSRAPVPNRQLEEKVALLEEALQREKRQRELPISAHQKTSMSHREVNTSPARNVSLKDSSTSSEHAWNCLERAVQTLSDGTTLPLDLVSISKSELVNLENDMKTLRELVRAKEEMWSQAMERERNYREHWVRLSRELITVRQQLDSRETDVKNLERKLTDQTTVLRAAQKELSLTKKQLQKNQRSSAGSGRRPTTVDHPDPRETQHSKLAEPKHESPRQSLASRFRYGKTSPTKDVKTNL